MHGGNIYQPRSDEETFQPGGASWLPHYFMARQGFLRPTKQESTSPGCLLLSGLPVYPIEGGAASPAAGEYYYLIQEKKGPNWAVFCC